MLAESWRNAAQRKLAQHAETPAGENSAGENSGSALAWQRVAAGVAGSQPAHQWRKQAAISRREAESA